MQTYAYMSLLIIIIWVVIIHLIIKAIRKNKYNKAYKLQLLEEQNEILRKMVEDKAKD